MALMTPLKLSFLNGAQMSRQHEKIEYVQMDDSLLTERKSCCFIYVRLQKHNLRTHTCMNDA